MVALLAPLMLFACLGVDTASSRHRPGLHIISIQVNSLSLLLAMKVAIIWVGIGSVENLIINKVLNCDCHLQSKPLL